MDKRLKEILERKKEIRTQIEAGGEIDFEALNTEIDELDKEARSLEARAAVASKLNDDDKGIEARILGGSDDLESRQTKESVKPEERWMKDLESEEYRKAWAKDMMGEGLTSEERNFMDQVNQEYRNFTHTTKNSEILIPKSVADGIWARAEEVSVLWSRVNKFRIRGNITLLTGGKSDKARFYDEETEVVSDKLEFGEINLTGHELAKAIEVTWKLKKMSIEDFIAYLIREIGKRMGEALSYVVYEGKGSSPSDGSKPEPLGIKTALMAEEGTPRIINAANPGELVYTDLTKFRAALHAAYASGSNIYANSLTVWNVLANIVDGIGRPLFMPDAMNGSVGKILGVSVFEDAGISEGELMLGNLDDGYDANINEDITMYTEDHMKKRITEYMGYAIVDGAPKDTEAFAILNVGTLPEA
ncbi:phage major capsid protein [Jeotgalicoccus halotolerans]|uniref:phage major capsid protein n=1 Tax=Jeotgalicoccus halotolerans TaxID=157227 RepID=UPI0035159431